jgi:hypothetical protein
MAAAIEPVARILLDLHQPGRTRRRTSINNLAEEHFGSPVLSGYILQMAVNMQSSD